MNKDAVVPLAQGTPRVDACHTANGWKIGELVDLARGMEAEVAALSAQVVELQDTIRNARVQREAAEAQVEALQCQVAALQELVEHLSK